MPMSLPTIFKLQVVILSGINFTKLEKFATFLGLEMISSSTFHRIQRLYCIPAIQSWWEWQRGEIFEEFLGRDVVLSGDGQCDSPGRTAKIYATFCLKLNLDMLFRLKFWTKDTLEEFQLIWKERHCNKVLMTQLNTSVLQN